MTIKNYNVVCNTVDITLDRTFKQIKFIKIENFTTNILPQKILPMESEEIEIRYTKDKSNFSIFVSSKSTLLILIKEIDHKTVMYSYLLNTTSTDEPPPQSNNDTSELFLSGFAKLMKLNNDNNDTVSKVCPIKNENIFAEIKKKNGT